MEVKNNILYYRQLASHIATGKNGVHSEWGRHLKSMEKYNWTKL